MQDRLFIIILSGIFIISIQHLSAKDDKDTTNPYSRANLLLEERKYQEALTDYQAFIQQERKKSLPDLVKISESLNNIGICYYLMNNYREAINWFEEALQEDLKTGIMKSVATRYNNLGMACKQLGLYDRAAEYYKKALVLDEEQNDLHSIAISYNNLGSIYDSWGRYDTAIYYYDKSLKYKELLNDSSGMAISLNNIGLVYKSWEKYTSAIEYFEAALKIEHSLGRKQEIPRRLNNLGLTYNLRRQYDKALDIFNEALVMALEQGNKELLAGIYNNMGSVYLNLQKPDEAVSYHQQALAIYEEAGNQASVATVLANLAEIYTLDRNYLRALELLSRSTEISEAINMRNQTQKNYLAYSNLYTSMGNYPEALNYYKKFVALKDALYAEEIHKQITDFEIRYETEKKDNEITLLKQQQEIQALKLKKEKIIRDSLLGGIGLLLLLAAVIFWSLVQKRRANKLIANEKSKSDSLLLNILPEKIASDLKEKGTTEPQSYENVTVCFTDMAGFTEIAARLEPQQLIDELNIIFTAFDKIIQDHHCERIKTIGDSYMAVCGLPDANPKHAENIIRAAVEMIHFLEKKNLESEIEWYMRVGIHSGSVIAGVVGTRKYLYDVFGDTINTASRIETASEPMRINVSEDTYNLVMDKFKFEPRGAFEVKGKGLVNMYYVKA